MFFLEEKLASF